jgi:hypothetical protein
VCDQQVGRCVACNTNSDCKSDAGLVFCVNQKCAACRDKNDCHDPARPFCHGGICEGCTSNLDCAPKVCNPANGVCVECLGETDCASQSVRKHCKLATLTCVECFQDSHCGDLGVCTGGNVCLCKACTEDGQCGGGKCLDGKGGKFCSQACANDSGCPFGFDCGSPVSGYCAPAELISCQALADTRRRKACTEDSQCGLSVDNHSRTLGCPNQEAVFCSGQAGGVCSFRADEAHDCPPGTTYQYHELCLLYRCLP